MYHQSLCPLAIPGKFVESICDQMQYLLPFQHTVLANKIEPEVYEAVKALLPDVVYNVKAKTLTLRSELSSKRPDKLPGTLAIISGSSPDLRVAEECRMIAEHLGCYVFQVPRARLLSSMQSELTFSAATSLPLFFTCNPVAG